MERISTYKPAALALLFVNDLVLLASSGGNLQLALGQFAVRCEGVGMRSPRFLTGKGQWRAPAPSGGAQGFAQEWGENEVGGWCRVCSNVDTASGYCGEESWAQTGDLDSYAHFMATSSE